MKKDSEKTNVMRVLDQKKIPYEAFYYDGEGLSGEDVARVLGEDERLVYKTLVTRGRDHAYYVFVIPVAQELDLKKAASCAGEKSIEMIKQKELLPLTGYIHGGCSPVGMKKAFPTFLDRSAEDKESIFVSAGRVGAQVRLSPKDLEKVIKLGYAPLTK
ncbi:MAG: Cys-tRNA(Pro) deacylase [Eubacteriaceae bacterium]|nr:Cys-tRNA(Pro) deacylase [Eubacteriaceae bacterium]